MRADRFAKQHAEALGIEIESVSDLRSAIVGSDICITCTPSRRVIVERDWVPAGGFVAAVGADNENKHAHTLTLDRKRSKVFAFLPETHRAAVYRDDA